MKDDYPKLFEPINIGKVQLMNRVVFPPISTNFALEDAGIIEMAGYREEGGGAPEKLWRLKVRRIGIDLVTGEIFRE
jgi:hypothetical protein